MIIDGREVVTKTFDKKKINSISKKIGKINKEDIDFSKFLNKEDINEKTKLCLR